MLKFFTIVCTLMITFTATVKADILPIKKDLNLSPKDTVRLTLSLKKGDYLRGLLTSDQYFQATIFAPDGHKLRQLSRPFSHEARVFFLTPSSGDYQLQISGAEKKITEVTLSLRSVPLATPQQGNLPETASPLVQQAISLWQQGESPEDIWRLLSQAGTPLIEPSPSKNDNLQWVTFLSRGAQHRVLLLGAPGYEHDPLYRLGDTDIWFRSYLLPDDTRMSYQLAPDVPYVAASGREQRMAILATAQKDPYNPNVWAPDGELDIFAVKSVLELKNAPSDQSIKGHGQIEGVKHYQIDSPRLGNRRAIDIWLPDQFNQQTKNQPVPLVIFFDGKAYQSKVPTPRILHNLIQEEKIPPVVAVFIDNPSNQARAKELPCNTDFADFMAKELLPFIKEKTGFTFRAETTILAGSSFGGLASACTAYHYPEYFGQVLSLSGSFWWSPAESDRPEWLNARFAQSPRLPLRFYLSAGRFETDFGESGIINANRQLAQILDIKGYPVILEEFSAGHDYFHWRAVLARGLIYLLK